MVTANSGLQKIRCVLAKKLHNVRKNPNQCITLAKKLRNAQIADSKSYITQIFHHRVCSFLQKARAEWKVPTSRHVFKVNTLCI